MKSAFALTTLTGLVSLTSALPQFSAGTTTTSSSSSSTTSSSATSTSSSATSTSSTATNGFPFGALPFGAFASAGSSSVSSLTSSTSLSSGALVASASASSSTTGSLSSTISSSGVSSATNGFPFNALPFGNLFSTPNTNSNSNAANSFSNFGTTSNTGTGSTVGTSGFSGPASSFFPPPVAGQNLAAPASAVYTMSNDNNNTVIAYPLGANGTIIGNGVQYVTNGNGGRANTTSNPLPAALLSQGAIQVVGNYLLAVNAGSGTMTMFQINCQNPTQLSMVGQPVNTLGDWPNTIAASQNLQMACVGNTGARSGVACFGMTPSGLVALDSAQRNVTLTPVQSNPPSGPPNTLSTLSFNADESALILSVKGNPNAPGGAAPGFFNVYAVTNSTVSTTAVRSAVPGTMGPFGFMNLPNNQLLVTDALAQSLDLYQLNTTNLSLNRINRSNTTSALCWVAGSPVSGNVYTTAFQDFILAGDPLSGNLTQQTNLTDGNPNLADLSTAADKVYALSYGVPGTGPSISVSQVLDSQGGLQEIQNFNLSSGLPTSLDFNTDGLAVFLNDGTCQLASQGSSQGAQSGSTGAQSSLISSLGSATTAISLTSTATSVSGLGSVGSGSTTSTASSSGVTSVGFATFTSSTLSSATSTTTNAAGSASPVGNSFFNNAGGPPVAIGVPAQTQKVRRSFELAVSAA